MVKEELSSEEKFFEKAVITEKFVKKYKKLMIVSVILIVILISANIAYDINKQNTKDAANVALLELMNNSDDAAALIKLESLSPALHDAWIYSKAVTNRDIVALESLKGSKDIIVGDMASYELAAESKDMKKLDDYVMKQNSIYKDLARIQSAILLIESGKTAQAQQKLSLISIDSSLAQIAASLMHYGVK